MKRNKLGFLLFFIILFGYSFNLAWAKWYIEVVVPPSGLVSYESSLVIDTNDYPHIAFSAPWGLKYGSWNGTSWSIESVSASKYGYSISLGLDTNNYPHI